MEDHALYSAPSTPKPTDNELSSPARSSPVLGSEFTYKMSDGETRQLIKLRASNKKLFTGQKHSARLAWRVILKEMCLQKKLSTHQAKKKWDNLLNKYKELKNPPPGIMVIPSAWRWFSVMDDAMEGRLDNSAPELSIMSVAASRDSDFKPNKPCSRRYVGTVRKEPVATQSVAMQPAATMTSLPRANEIEFLVNDNDILWTPEGVAGDASQQEMDSSDRRDIEQERAQLDNDRALVERERELLERERMVLEREHVGLERELAALDRDRAAVERERASVERDRAAVDRERAVLEKEMARQERYRLEIGRNNMVSSRDYTAAAVNGRTNMSDGISHVTLDPECLERRQKFLDLFEKLLEKF
ncbi:uncharacterized protein LOC134062194 [Sardina pilchardus]|uniref:uncharacterized protein LOC134062194 n=1 Tax=Sardina pilchardus TaxID=27697 RepID=UPI002E149ADE